MKIRYLISADEGKILTNGKDYAQTTILAVGEDPNSFYEITKEEYEAQRAAEVENEP